MDGPEFKALMLRAQQLDSVYGTGYQRGLRRLYYGEKLGTAAEHETWLNMGLQGDTRLELGRGYRDGFAGRRPQPRRPRPGRPQLSPEQKPSSRSIQLNDARWKKLKELGSDWLDQAIDRVEQPKQFSATPEGR